MQPKKWKLLSKKDVSPSKHFPISEEEIELPNGKIINYYKSKLANVAMVIPITKENEVIFVKQYKHGIEEICIEFPAGRIDDGKTAKQTAISELSEETGINISENDLVVLAELWTEPSKSTVRVFCFIATEVEITHNQRLEETELIELIKVPISDLDDFVLAENIHASDTLALILIAKKKFPEIFGWGQAG